MAKILIVEDDKIISNWIGQVVGRCGHFFATAYTLAEGLRMADAQAFDLVFLDTLLPDGHGIDAMSRFRMTGNRPEMIVITGIGDPDEAARAITAGAWDYVEKSASVDTIKHPMLRALAYRSEKAKGLPPVDLKRKEIIGKSPRMSTCFDLLAQAGSSDVNVLVSGESGTGKELFAKAIHYNSSRARHNFVIIDCTALPESLVESVLFGHARGAFTSAYASQEGLIKQADKGTVFLDEIGELPLSVQKSFLRVVQEHRFRPVGGNQEVSSDFRLVAATNRNLEEMVAQGQFREDLLFRLRTLEIELPPLRECLEDIHDLILHYNGVLCQRFGIENKGFSIEFIQILVAYKWPGNVRELIHTLEKALLAAQDEPILYPKHLPTYVRIQVARDGFEKRQPPLSGGPAHVHAPFKPSTLKEVHKAVLEEAERVYFENLLSFVKGNIAEACRISGLSRSRLYTLLKKYKEMS